MKMASADEFFVCCLEDVSDLFRCFGSKKGKEGRQGERGKD